MCGGLDYLVQVDEVRVAQEFEDVQLAGYALVVGDFVYFLFLQELYCHFLARWLVDAQAYLTECALPEYFTYYEVADLFSLFRHFLVG